jgi:hypothetical protein
VKIAKYINCQLMCMIKELHNKVKNSFMGKGQATVSY